MRSRLDRSSQPAADGCSLLLCSGAVYQASVLRQPITTNPDKNISKERDLDTLTGQLLNNLSAGLLSGGVHIESVSGYEVQNVQQLDRYSVDMADCNMACTKVLSSAQFIWTCTVGPYICTLFIVFLVNQTPTCAL